MRSETVGQKVRVYWGYGLGFRVDGLGTITRVFAKSVRVQLDEPVADPYDADGKIGWPAGLELKGIPRTNNPNWRRYENCVEAIG